MDKLTAWNELHDLCQGLRLALENGIVTEELNLTNAKKFAVRRLSVLGQNDETDIENVPLYQDLKEIIGQVLCNTEKEAKKKL